jgi:hypothetical protein
MRRESTRLNTVFVKFSALATTLALLIGLKRARGHLSNCLILISSLPVGATDQVAGGIAPTKGLVNQL